MFGVEMHRFGQIFQLELSKVGVVQPTVVYYLIPIIGYIMTLLATHGMDITLDDTIRSQIYLMWNVLELVGPSLRRQMKEDTPLEFNDYNNNDPCYHSRCNALHARYPGVFQPVMPTTPITVSEMVKLEAVFEALETARVLMCLMLPNPDLALDTINDFNYMPDLLTSVERRIVSVPGASCKSGAHLHPVTGMRDPFWWKIVTVEKPLYETGACCLDRSQTKSAKASLKSLEAPRADDSMRSSRSRDQGSILNFEYSREVHRWSMTTEGDSFNAPDPNVDDPDEATPKPRFTATMDTQAAAPQHPCVDRIPDDDLQLETELLASSTIKPLALHCSPRLEVPDAPSHEALPVTEAPVSDVGPEESQEKMTPRTATERLEEMVHEYAGTPGQNAEDAPTDWRPITDRRPVIRITEYRNVRVEDSPEIVFTPARPGFVRISANQPMRIRVSRPIRPTDNSNASLSNWLKAIDSGATFDLNCPREHPQVTEPVKLPVVEPLGVKSKTQTKPSKKSLLSRLNPLKRLIRRNKD